MRRELIFFKLGKDTKIKKKCRSHVLDFIDYQIILSLTNFNNFTISFQTLIDAFSHIQTFAREGRMG